MVELEFSKLMSNTCTSLLQLFLLVHAVKCVSSTTTSAPVDCSKPPSIANGQFTPNQTSYVSGSVITYSCNTGYSVETGNTTRTCQSSGTWSGTEPTCSEIDCLKPSAVSYGSFSPNQTTYSFATTITYTCESGYIATSGNVSRSCGFNGTWSGTEPTCSEIDCLKPSAVSYGSFSPNQTTYSFATTITYTCESGYIATSGNVSRSCGFNGTWSGTEPTCSEIDCLKPSAVSYGSFSPNQTTYSFATTITYTCESGYIATSGNVSRSCGFNGTWSGTEPTCPEIDCLKPSAVSYGSFSPNQTTYSFATTITYTCESGYIATSGNVSRSCGFNGTWSGTEPTCSEIDCLKPSAVSYGSFSPNQTTYSFATTITYTCESGYIATSGNVSRSCGFNGTWSGTEPTCSEIDCLKPSAVSYGSFSPNQTTYSFATTITYTCESGYIATSGNVSRSCGFNGTWSGTEPTCSEIDCLKPPTVVNGNFTPDASTYSFGTTIAYSCDLGYNVTAGNTSRSCGFNASWTGTEPTCTVSACLKPATVPLTTMSPDTQTYAFSSTLNYTCTTGYEITSGDAVWTCQNTGLWLGTTPTCTLVTCAAPAVVEHSSHIPVQGSYNYNSDINYTCDLAYTLTAGSDVRTCDASGSWTGNAPICTISACIEPSSVPFSNVTPHTTLSSFGTTLTYTCNLGYNHTSGDLTRICQNSGAWTGTDPVCTVSYCLQPNGSLHSNFEEVLTLYEFGYQLNYTCDHGYYHDAGDLSWTCLNTGNWQGEAPSCPLVECDAPEAVADSNHTPVHTKYDFNTSITYQCDLSFNMTSGNAVRTCDYDFTWTGDAPVCTVAACLQPAPVAFATVTPDSETYEFDETVNYTCNVGYNHSTGDLVRTCTPTGQFNGSAPSCPIVTCDPPLPEPHASYDPTAEPHNYNTQIIYTCDLGYEQTGGNLTRECDHTGTWTADPPVCTIIKCAPPALNMNMSYEQFGLATYNWNTTVIYTCDIGYEYDSGDMSRSCLHTKIWSGTTPTCKIVTCDTTTVDHMSFEPPDPALDYNLDITYTCDIGYNHSHGDLVRTCQPSGDFNGSLPNCTIILCDPPTDPVSHASNYTPNLPKHEFNTTVTYSCDEEYHYVSGSYSMVCNESGTWPGVDLDCTVQHSLSLAPSQQDPAIIFIPDTSATIEYVFDGLCDISAVVDLSGLTAVPTVSGSTISTVVSATASSYPAVYRVTLNPTEGVRSWNGLTTRVFYGEAVAGITARLVKNINFLHVGELATFETNLTAGTSVQLKISFEENETVSSFYSGHFTTVQKTHTFNIPGVYDVEIETRNLVSNVKTNVQVTVIHALNNINFVVDNSLANTTLAAVFSVTLSPSVDLPVGTLNISIDYSHGTGDTSQVTPSVTDPLPISYDFSHLFPTQGIYTIYATVDTVLEQMNFSLVLNVWDTLDPLELIVLHENDPYYITNTTTFLGFDNTPNAGFEYSIDFTDGTTYSNNGTDILYQLYSLGEFNNTYTSPQVYNVTWNAHNGAYTKSGSVVITVQNALITDYGLISMAPMFLKFPWSTVQIIDIAMNFTLSDTAHFPTAATCEFDGDDGTNLKTGIPFDFFFSVEHGFRREGVINSSYFCRNLVSTHTYYYSNTVLRFQATDITVTYADLVPLNKSDSVIMHFHIENNEFAMLPLNVTFSWTFDDNTPIQTNYYDKVTYTHGYSQRGDYLVKLKVDAAVSVTTNELTLPLRLGLMYLHVNYLIGFINDTKIRYTVWGEFGDDVTYTVQFDDGTPDGTCHATNVTGCHVDHFFPHHGHMDVVITVNNGTFTEIDGVRMTIDNPIENLIIDFEPEIRIPDGWVTVMLNITEDALYLPDLQCTFDFADAIKRDFQYDNQTIRYGEPFVHQFQYISLGRRQIGVKCKNLINETDWMYKWIKVTNENFDYRGTFDRFYSQRESPMIVSSMRDEIIFSRLGIEADFHRKTPFYEWTMGTDARKRSTLSGSPVFDDAATALFPRGIAEDGVYEVILEVSFVEEPENEVFEPTFIEFVSPPPFAYITGGNRRYALSGVVEFNAADESFDPVFPGSTLSYSWDCKSYVASDFSSAEVQYSTGNGQDCVLNGLSLGRVNLDTEIDVSRTWYSVTVNVTSSRGSSSTFTQFLKVTSSSGFYIKCLTNCMTKVAVASKILLTVYMPDNCPASYTWKLFSVTGIINSFHTLTDKSDSGITKRTLSIRSGSLLYDTKYRVTVDITKDASAHNTLYYDFLTNKKPSNGNCSVFPDEQEDQLFSPTGNAAVQALSDAFNLTCIGWQDEGFYNTMSNKEPLTYFFYFQYGSRGDIQKQILYYDAGATSPVVNFRVGDRANSYTGVIKLQITDIFGDYTELTYEVQSEPQFKNSDINDLEGTDILNAVTNYIEQFMEDIKKANRSLDFRTLATKVEALASVYTDLVVMTEIQSLTLSPDDLTSLGYKTNNGTAVTWNDYWNLITSKVDTSSQDYLIGLSQNLTNMLLYQVNSWPPNTRMQMMVIEHLIRALNATFSNLDYLNVEAAESAAKIVKFLSDELYENIQQKFLPTSERIESVLFAIIDVIANILEFLQTVLTPNLPHDPTVDEMRQYLEYIRIFKTAEDILSDPLSLQEQTFVAQKQLQKYAVQKEIKSEASKNAFPNIKSALKVVGDALKLMTDIGHPYLSLDNDYIHISMEVNAFYDFFGETLERPRVRISLDNLAETVPGTCLDSKVSIQTIVFRENPYFWSNFGDRITSFVPTVKLDGANFGSEVNIHFENKVMPDCKDETPQYDDDNVDKLIYVLFDRRHSDDDILLFIRPNTTLLVYELYFKKDEKPTMQDPNFLYQTKIATEHWTVDDGYKLLIKAENLPETGKMWIAFKPVLVDPADESKKEDLIKEKFCANVTAVNCLALTDDYAWDKTQCRVSESSSRKTTTCVCKSPTDLSTLTVGTTFYVPPNMIDFKRIIVTHEPLGNKPVLVAIIGLFLVYLLMLLWAWREDEKDFYKWELALLVDNDIADDYFYIIKVYTGVRAGAGTKSKVGFILVGEHNDTGSRILDDDSHIGFESGSVRSFVMGTRVELGGLMCIRIWHDDSGGNEATWFLNKIVVTDLQTGQRYYMKCDDWFSNNTGDMRCDKVLHCSTEHASRDIKESASYVLAENHLWVSIFVRPFRTCFSRVQRVSTVLCLLFVSMIVGTVFLTSSVNFDESAIVLGPFIFSMEIFLISLKTAILASIPIFIIAFLFKHSKTKPRRGESNARRWYRTANSKLRLDDSVMNTDYFPPASAALGDTHYILPHFCVYLAWVVLWPAIILATYFSLSGTFDWPEMKSTAWVSVLLFSAITLIVVVEGIKVILLIILITGVCQLNFDPPDPPIDVPKLREIAKRNSRFMTQGPQYGMYLDYPKLQNAEELEINRRRRSSEEALLKVFYQLVLYSFMLFVVYFISYETRDPRSFYFNNHMKDLFNFEQVTDVDSYISWIKGTFTEVYFSENYFGAEYAEDTNYKQYIKDLANVRVGPARLRQVRVKEENCVGVLARGEKCYNKFENSRQDTASYCIGWISGECDLEEKSTKFSSPAWQYVSAGDVWGFPTTATYTTYAGGGYFMKLDVNKDVCLQIYEELFTEYQWLDRQTRAIILEFTVYTANANLFSYVQFVAEFPEVGGVIPFTDVATFRLFSTSNDAYLVHLCEFFFLIFVVIGTVKIFYEVCSAGLSFFKDAWNVMDVIAILASYVTTGVFIYKLLLVEFTLAKFREDKNAYVGFENLAFYDFIVTAFHALLVFILSIRLSRALGFSEKIHEMAAVIITAGGDLIGFCVIFAITYAAYVMMGTLLFGKDTEKYKDMFQTYGTLTEAIVGKNRLNAILTSNPGLAEFYYFTFVLFVLLTLTTMAAAILNFSITYVKEDVSKNEEFKSIIGIMTYKMVSFMKFVGLDRFVNSDEKDQKEIPKKRRTSDSDVHDIVSDLRYFFTEWRKKRKKKYQKITLDC